MQKKEDSRLTSADIKKQKTTTEDEDPESNDDEEEEEEEGEEEEEISMNPNDLIFKPDSQQRNWLKKHGKQHFIDFEEKELQDLRGYFSSLDDDGSGQIGVDELEDPLIALGLVDTRAEVEEIVKTVDEDGSGEIEFGEFLGIIKGGNSKGGGGGGGGEGGGSSAIYSFFKRLTSGYYKSSEAPNIPFSLFITSFRRRKILDALMFIEDTTEEETKKKKEGQRVLNAYKN